MKPCLWLHVEGNTNKGGGGRGAGQPNKNLEEEVIRCVKYWQMYNMEKYPIYALCMTNNPPSMETLTHLAYNGVKFIWDYDPNTDWFPAGWWNTPLAGLWMERNFNYNPLIHLDLDMVLLKPYKLPSDWKNYDAVIPIYTEKDPDDRQIDPDFMKTFITCYIVSNKGFYRQWYYKMLDLAKIWQYKYPDLMKYSPDAAKHKVSKEVWWDYCNLEEHAVDVLYHKDDMNIKGLDKAMIGESQGYGNARDATDKEIWNNIYFLHYHYDPEKPAGFEEKIKEYITRRVKCKQLQVA